MKQATIFQKISDTSIVFIIQKVTQQAYKIFVPRKIKKLIISAKTVKATFLLPWRYHKRLQQKSDNGPFLKIRKAK